MELTKKIYTHESINNETARRSLGFFDADSVTLAEMEHAPF